MQSLASRMNCLCESWTPSDHNIVVGQHVFSYVHKQTLPLKLTEEQPHQCCLFIYFFFSLGISWINLIKLCLCFHALRAWHGWLKCSCLLTSLFHLLNSSGREKKIKQASLSSKSLWLKPIFLLHSFTENHLTCLSDYTRTETAFNSSNLVIPHYWCIERI